MEEAFTSVLYSLTEHEPERAREPKCQQCEQGDEYVEILEIDRLRGINPRHGAYDKIPVSFDGAVVHHQVVGDSASAEQCGAGDKEDAEHQTR